MRDEKDNSAALRLGFGMLRVHPEDPRHREALRDALLAGVDLFDLGHFEGESPEAPLRFAAKTRLLQGLVAEYAPSPVRAIVRGSLGAVERFARPSPAEAKIEWIYLVADPEFALPSLEWDSARLYAGLAREFDALEARCRSGELAAYGVGSAALTYPKENPDALALEPLLGDPEPESSVFDSSAPGSARSANRRFFEWVEFPLNLFESQAATEETQTVGPRNGTLLDAAAAWGLRTIARRPLDAITEDGLRRLVAYPDHHRLDLHEAVRLTLETALAAEGEFLAKKNHARIQGGATPSDLDPLWAHRLRDQLKHVSDPEQWKEILRRRIEPDLRAIRSENASEGQRYSDAMDALLLAVRLWCEKHAAERNERLRAKIIEASPTLGRKRLAEDRDLALLALRIYRSIPGLDYVLLGMRSPPYVQSFTAAQASASLDGILPREELRATLIAAHAALQKGSS